MMTLVPLHLATVSSSISPANVEPSGIAERSLKLWLPCTKGKATSGVLSWQLLGQPQGALKLLFVAFSSFTPQLRVVDCEP
jgi:hypothetical protein